MKGVSMTLGVRTASAIVLVCCAASLFAACGGSAGGLGESPSSAAAASPAATYVSGLLPAAAVDALERYFSAVAAGDAEAATALLTPSSPLRGDPTMGIAAIRDVRVERRLLGAPPAGVSAMPMVSAWVDGQADSAWGPGSRHDFFMAVTEAPAGMWLIDHMATSP
jgi:hypothetical protein